MSLTLKEKHELFFGSKDTYINFLVDFDKLTTELEESHGLKIPVTFRLVDSELEFRVNDRIFKVEELTNLYLFVVEDIYGQLGILVINPNDTEGIYKSTALIFAKGQAWILKDAQKELSELVMNSRVGVDVLGYKTRTGRMEEI